MIDMDPCSDQPRIVRIHGAGSLSTIGLFGPNLDLDTDDGRVFRAILAFLHAKSQ
jgi:hypothetical protein